MNARDYFMHFWWFPWWMIFPLMWFVFGLFAMYMRHQRHRDMMNLIERYAAQGKEPPEAVLNAMSRPGRNDWRAYDGNGEWRADYFSYRYSPFRCLRRGVILLSLAGAFFAMDYMHVLPDEVRNEGVHPFLIPAIILGALGVGSLVIAMFSLGSKSDNRRDRP